MSVISLSLLALLASIVGAAGCATMTRAPLGREAVRTVQSTIEPPPPVVRQVLERGSTFKYTFARLSDNEVKEVIDTVLHLNSTESPRDLTQDLKDLRDRLTNKAPAAVKREILRLGEDDAFTSGGVRSPATIRRDLLAALPKGEIQKLAAAFVAVEGDRTLFCRDRRPRIHDIGIQPIITFEKKSAALREGPRARAVRIPLEGRDLHPRCVTFEVTVTGTVPLSRSFREAGEIQVIKPTDDTPDTANVLLLDPLIDRLKTRDQLTIQIAVSQYDAYRRPDKERVVSFATRTFTLYEVEDYRDQVLRSRIAPHDLRAFPLPEVDAELLFGSLVAREFFVVRLSVRNTESEAKLISTGMITAYGRALVEPVGAEAAFTVPVMVVPSSLQQTFTILDDEEANQPRAWTFRALEFAGALASAATSAFGVPLDVSKGISLFTGVGIPQGKKLFPDRWPGYKRNVVAYGMPDLIKVPANAVTDHRFVFFPKKDIELVIADHNMFANFLDSADGKAVERLDRTSHYFFGKNIGSVAPKVRVISLAFDNLDIKFEKVFEVKMGTRQEVARLLDDIPKEVDGMLSLVGWTASPPTQLAEGITEKRWTAIKKLIADAQKKQQERQDTILPTKTEVSDLLKVMAAVVDGFGPALLGKELLENAETGLDRLKRLKDRVVEINKQIAGGVDPERFADEVKSIRETAGAATAARQFYLRAARALTDPEAEKQLNALISTPQQAETASKAVAARLEELRLARPSAKVMPGAFEKK